jgi:Ni,Fe-hydrogenase III component G
MKRAGHGSIILMMEIDKDSKESSKVTKITPISLSSLMNSLVRDTSTSIGYSKSNFMNRP